MTSGSGVPQGAELGPILARRSYLVCSVQRAGSWLLCHALEDSGVLGRPAEYFHRGDEPFWRGRWRISGAASEDAFLCAVQRQPVTPNGVWGAKMMWNYLDDAVARLRAWPRLGAAADAGDPEVLAAAFPGLRYLWLRREDKLRQAISWWRAAATGQYELAPDEMPAEPPAFDREAIGRLLRYAQACEAGWQDWFAAHSIRPLEIVYEDLIEDVDRAARNVAGFLGVSWPAGLAPVRPRMRRQADQRTERLAALFNRHDEP